MYLSVYPSTFCSIIRVQSAYMPLCLGYKGKFCNVGPCRSKLRASFWSSQHVWSAAGHWIGKQNVRLPASFLGPSSGQLS